MMTFEQWLENIKHLINEVMPMEYLRKIYEETLDFSDTQGQEGY